jgi:hypothetical protein
MGLPNSICCITLPGMIFPNIWDFSHNIPLQVPEAAEDLNILSRRLSGL